MTFVVVGIGHSLRGDDAAGLEAVRAWQQQHPATARHPNVRVELVESPGLELVSAIEGAEGILLVDAVRSGAAAGKLHRLNERDVANLGASAGSMHGWGIPEALRLSRAMGTRADQGNLMVLGIEAEQTEVGAGLSAAVQSGLSAAAAAIEAEISAFLSR